MIVAIMQPYFFPYIGYFQLMHAADVFVVYDDVQYMKGGWVNRNRIRLNNVATWLTVPIKRASTFLDINERSYKLDQSTLERVTNKLKASYVHAPRYHELICMIERNLLSENTNVAAVNTQLLRETIEYMGIDCQFIMSSELGVSRSLHGEDRVIAICQALRATDYVNAIGGINLYSAKRFCREGLRLAFLRTQVPPERLIDGPSHLSILDTLFQASAEQITAKICNYELVPG